MSDIEYMDTSTAEMNRNHEVSGPEQQRPHDLSQIQIHVPTGTSSGPVTVIQSQPQRSSVSQSAFTYKAEISEDVSEEDASARETADRFSETFGGGTPSATCVNIPSSDDDPDLYQADNDFKVKHPSAPLYDSRHYGNPRSSSSKEMSVDYPAEGDNGSARNKQSQRDQHSPINPQSTQDVDLNQAKDEREEKQTTLDEATVYVSVEWPGKAILSWKSVLQKSLQSWLNNNVKETDCTVERLNGKLAEVKIHPPSVVEDLLKLKETRVTFKDKAKTSATVRFHGANPPSFKPWNQSNSKPSSMEDLPPTSNMPQDVKLPITVSANIDIGGYKPEVRAALHRHYQTADHKLAVKGSFDEVNQFHREFTKIVRETEPEADWNDNAEAAQSMSHNGMKSHEDPGQKEISFPVPLIHFVYLNQAYRKEMEDIEKRNGVEINAEVKVSIKEVTQKTGRDVMLTKAHQEFSDLFQKCVVDLDSISTHLTPGDPGDLMNTLKNIQNEETRLVLNVSANGYVVFGPAQSIMAVKKALGVKTTVMTFGMDHSSTEKASGFAGGPVLRSPKTPRMIGMDIKDPLLSHGLAMDQTHWDLMKSAFHEKITAIKNTFRVDFMEEKSPGKVKIKTRPTISHTPPAVSLESHAIRALMHLYQKVATSAMSCHLLDPTHAKTVGDKLEEIHPRHRCVWAGENYGPWRLIGLPQHLGPAVKELEMMLKRPMFKEEDKHKIEYPGDRSSTGAAMGGAVGDGGATGGPEDDNCSICMDRFINKRKLSCSHEFCTECLRKAVEFSGPRCPLCKDVFGKVEGDQPEGTMKVKHESYHCLPGYRGYGMIVISYDIPSGKQTKKHSNPGKGFIGAHRIAYLPDNQEGNEVLKLLERAFNQKLIFTVGTSRTTGTDDCVTWNDIHHKTNIDGGAQGFGYPDPDYLSRVKSELKAKGIE
ncbi:E3 ubiquitin-protein ligase DTX3L isoform X1 [Oncorhynchus mykiss]|uniref:E3 ubiquitin-protein ligase n=2 Tax=Oncorhynchus mykiss TaxID=8022 RepID=A0A8C7TF62_ONCMY|nr:E3 ubiquitin-protein ligase DTX3L isoform X1 [Oncorhynchus mykiss]XP_021424825.2 E3 ubiquitin-protein ligase DTX3L isoform X1 [Oncorhynchus mykiss]XP_021424826.2 E3 ubiquitin-protein ligase DTX3L isoform X1 [Oncorhynchus mykiss]